MQCPECGTNMIRLTQNWVCENHEPPICKKINIDKSVQFVTLQYDSITWFEHIWSNDSSYPPIIAHEYRRLHYLMNNGQFYGALLQIKDMFEVLLKLPILITAAQIYSQKNDRCDSTNRLLAELLEKPISLGDWEGIAQRLRKQEYIAPELRIILNDITNIFDSQKGLAITNWRNDTIGHGALTFDDNPGFRNDLQTKIEAINRHLLKCANSYAMVNFYLYGLSGTRVLKGPDAVIALDYDQDDNLHITVGHGYSFSAYPYIILDEKGIFFFDNYNHSKRRSFILNYPEGKKKNGNTDLNQCWHSVLKEFEIKKYQDYVLTRERLNTIEETIYQHILAINDFQKPDYVYDWLNISMNQHDRGVFLLQMEQGMGKTCFCRAMDPLSMNIANVAPNDTSVRAYYINDNYASKLEYFTDHIRVLLKQNPRGEGAIASLPELGESSGTTEMVNLLNEALREHSRRWGHSRLLLILDGLDEIPIATKTIWDYIPSADQLPKGVYILTTSRLDHELVGNPFCMKKLREREYTSIREIRLKDINNDSQLRNYIRKSILKLKPGELPDDAGIKLEKMLISKSEGRLLYIRAYKDLMRLGHVQTKLPNVKDLMKVYLSDVENHYSLKYFRHFKDIMLILSSALEPLTLNEISFLHGDNGVNFKLLAFMNDARSFVQVERSYRGYNLHSIAHETWRLGIMKGENHRINEIVKNWHELVLQWDFHEDVFRSENNRDADRLDGETHLLANIVDYVDMYYNGSDKNQILCDNNLALKNIKVAGYISDIKNPEHYLLLRQVRMYSNAIRIWERKSGNYIKEIADALMERGKAWFRLTEYSGAIEDFNRAIDIMQKTSSLFDNSYSVAMAMIQRGNSLYKLINYSKALADFQQAAVLLENSNANDPNDYKADLAQVFMFQGKVYYRTNTYLNAIKAYNKAVNILRSQMDCNIEVDQNVYARLLMNRGKSYHKSMVYSKALRDYRKAVNIRKKLSEDNTLKDLNDLATALMYMGMVYTDMTQYEKALVYFNEAVDIGEKLDVGGKLLDLNDLARLLMNRGKAHYKKTSYEHALSDLNRAIKIREYLNKLGKLADQTDLAEVLLFRGKIFFRIKQYEDSIKDYDKAIYIYNMLSYENKNLDSNDLARIIMNRGKAYRWNHQYGKAFDDFRTALDIRTDLDVNRNLMNRNDLSTSLLYMGIAYDDLQQPYMGLEYLDRAVDELSQLDRIGMLYDRDDLARGYMCRGKLHDVLGNLQMAVKDFDLALQVRKALDNDKSLSDRKDLAILLKYRAQTLVKLERLNEAITDLFDSLDILKVEVIKQPYLNSEYLEVISEASEVLFVAFYDTPGLKYRLMEYYRSFKETCQTNPQIVEFEARINEILKPENI